MIGVRDGGLLNGLKDGFRVSLTVGSKVGFCDLVGGEGLVGGVGLVGIDGRLADGEEGDDFRIAVGEGVRGEGAKVTFIVGTLVGGRVGTGDGNKVGLVVGLSDGSGVAYSLLRDGGLVYIILRTVGFGLLEARRVGGVVGGLKEGNCVGVRFRRLTGAGLGMESSVNIIRADSVLGSSTSATASALAAVGSMFRLVG